MSGALVSPLLGWALLCGVGLGAGLWLLVSLVPRLGRPRLVHRLAPYLVDDRPPPRAARRKSRAGDREIQVGGQSREGTLG